MRMRFFYILCLVFLMGVCAQAQSVRKTESFDAGWKFLLGDNPQAKHVDFNDTQWRKLDLPHDWSIAGKFDEKNSTTQAEGGLPAGIGWYRKTFTLPTSSKNKNVFIDFDGIYRDSEVWINGHYLGKRPNGYISFEYELTNYLKFDQQNVIAVKVDNSAQPNSRWYSGSGIYRNVWLVTTNHIIIDHWGTFVTIKKVSNDSAIVDFENTIINRSPIRGKSIKISVETTVYDENGKVVGHKYVRDGEEKDSRIELKNDKPIVVKQQISLIKPHLWSPAEPYLYKSKTKVYSISLEGYATLTDEYITTFGIRTYNFDADEGFSLNGERMKIKGVCLHHDAGALGAAVNTRAIERQLQILMAMGCNAIRTSHNPPAPELLDLCDRMGFLVMDEAFDMWKKKKTSHDYHEDWDKWHVRDLQDQVLRDRNHPSVFVWSIGNEIREQRDSTGIPMTRELVGIVKGLDKTRPVTSALSDADPKKNFIYLSGALDLVGLNYHIETYADFQKNYPGQKFIGTEQMSALASRGHYDMPSDSIRRWPKNGSAVLKDGNPDYTVSSYDNVSAYWGSTQEETWKIIKKYDFLSGLFIWTGFDYLGEPVPYLWPARSAYFGIVDLAGFPKDAYYLYQSEWTNKPVLHLLPHWNWQPGKIVDVWAYYNNADEVELYLNGKSLGIRKKQGDDLHVMWRVKYEPGTLKAVSRKNGKTVLTTQVKTAGAPYQIKLTADRSHIKADGKDLSYITVSILDKQGNLVPDAANLVKFKISGQGIIKGVDNGYQANLEPFTAQQCKAFNGLCLAIVQSKHSAGNIILNAVAAGLQPATLVVSSGPL